MAKSSLLSASRSNARTRTLVQRADFVEPPPRVALGNLWQMPLLLVSLALFTLAAYLLVDPQPAPSFQRQLAIAQRDIDAERCDAAIGRLNDLLVTRPEPPQEVQARLLLAEALDRQIRRSRRLETPQLHRRIVEEIQKAYELGFVATPDSSDRLARSFEALGQIDEAAANYQRAVELLEQGDRAQRALPMRRSSIEMLVAHERYVTAAQLLKNFLDTAGLSDDERAWALGEMARIHIDAGRSAEARSLLAAALALSPDESIRGQVSFRLGYAAWKAGQGIEAHEHLMLARQQLGAGHPLDAEACYLLGRLAQERESFAEAAEHFDLVLRDYPETRIARLAAIARGNVRLLAGDDERGVSDLTAIADEVAITPALSPLKPELLGTLQRGGRILASREKYDLVLDLLSRELLIDPESMADCLARSCVYSAKAVEQAESEFASADDSDRPELEIRVREWHRRAGAVHLQYSQFLASAGDGSYAGEFWKGIDFLEQAPDLPAVIAALQQFAGQSPADPLTPEVFLRLGRAYQSAGRVQQAVEALAQLRSRYVDSTAAFEAGLLLASAYRAQGNTEGATAVLRNVIETGSDRELPGDIIPDALWALADLYMQEDLPGSALALLEQYGRRNAKQLVVDPNHAAQLAFFKGDCHRRLAAERISAGPGSPDSADTMDAELAAHAGASDQQARQFLEAASRLFEEAIALFAQGSPQTEQHLANQRLAHFYRAHCAFDLGQYERSIELYEAAARRYPDDLSVLAAQVQIASANAALRREAEARVAGQRARELLRRLPADALNDVLTLPRGYWEQWLKRTGANGEL